MEPIDLLTDFVRIESHDGIAEIRPFLLDVVDGASVHDTGCVVAEKHGDTDGRRIVLNSHMDVVPPHIPDERDGDVIRGWGHATRKAVSRR